jgi:hypothetical protein
VGCGGNHDDHVVDIKNRGTKVDERSVRRAWITSTGLVISLALGWGSSAWANGQGTLLPFGSLYAMVVDPAHRRVFVSGGPGSTVLAVLNDEGTLVQSIRVAGASGMVLVKHQLFVVAADTDNIGVIDTTLSTLAVMRTIEVRPFTTQGDITYVAGKLWFPATRDSSHWLVSADTHGSGSIASYPGPAFLDLRFTRHLPSNGSALSMFDDGSDPMTLSTYNLGPKGPVFSHVAESVGSLNIGGGDAAYLPDGNMVVAAGVPPTSDRLPGEEGFRHVNGPSHSVDLTYRTYVKASSGSDRRKLWPDAVDYTPLHPGLVTGGMIAGGAASLGRQDVWVFGLGNPSPLWTHDFGPGDITTLPRGVAWSADGQSIFVVAGSFPQVASPAAEMGQAHFFVLHPLAEPSSSLTGTPSYPSGQAPAMTRTAPSAEARSALPIQAVQVATLLGFLVALTSTYRLWFLGRKRARLGREPSRLMQRPPGDLLGPDERVLMAEPANGSGAIYSWTAIQAVALVMAWFLIPTFVVSRRWGIVTLVLVFVAEPLVLAGLFRWSVKPRQVLLTDRRLLVCEARPFNRRPGRVLYAEHVGAIVLSEPVKRQGLVHISLLSERGLTHVWISRFRRGRFRIADAIEAKSSLLSPSLSRVQWGKLGVLAAEPASATLTLLVVLAVAVAWFTPTPIVVPSNWNRYRSTEWTIRYPPKWALVELSPCSISIASEPLAELHLAEEKPATCEEFPAFGSDVGDHVTVVFELLDPASMSPESLAAEVRPPLPPDGVRLVKSDTSPYPWGPPYYAYIGWRYVLIGEDHYLLRVRLDQEVTRAERHMAQIVVASISTAAPLREPRPAQ